MIMKISLYIVAFFFIHMSGIAQINLVQNPSFEDYTSCPNMINEISRARYWSSIDTFHYSGADTNGLPLCAAEYCNECATLDHVTVPNSFFYHHYARTGKGMIQNDVYVSSLTTEGINFSQGRLKRTLSYGTTYCVTFYVLLEPCSTFFINRIGAYFDNGSIDTVATCDSPIFNMTPQIEYDNFIYDSVNWTKIQGNFVANGTESFITLGNFYYNYSTDTISTHSTWWYLFGGIGFNIGSTFYLIDDVSVIDMASTAYAGHDTSIALHDSVWVGNQDGYLPCYWYKNGVLVDSNVAGFWARPDTSCYYIMELDVCGNITRDTMHITVGHVGIPQHSLALACAAGASHCQLGRASTLFSGPSAARCCQHHKCSAAAGAGLGECLCIHPCCSAGS